MKKFNLTKAKQSFLFEFFFENQQPTRHIKNKVLNFAPSYKSNIQINFLQPIWNDF